MMIREAIVLADAPRGVSVGARPLPRQDAAAPAHVPVLLRECLEALRANQGGDFVDGTLGAGGHTAALLAAHPDNRVLALDRDPRMIAKTAAKLESTKTGTNPGAEAGAKPRLIIHRSDYRALPAALATQGWSAVDGILVDMGISRLHYEMGAGFSFREAAPLDMRLEPDAPTPTAAQILNSESEAQLADIFYHFGEIHSARRLARLICERRVRQPFAQADEFAAFVAAHLPPSRPRHGIHPATEAFQALRIAVNQELEGLEEFCAAALGCLKPGGRLAIIAFHSLEDRAIKHGLRALATGCICPPKLPRCACGRFPRARTVGSQPVKPGAEECAANPPSRSARLRVVEKLSEPSPARRPA